MLDITERQQLVVLIAGLYEFTDEGARARRLLLQQSGLARFVPTINLAGAPNVVAPDIVSRIEDFGFLPEAPSKTALGALLSYLLTLSDLPTDQKKTIAGLIIKYSLIADPLYLEKLKTDYGVSEIVMRSVAPANVAPAASKAAVSEPSFAVDLKDQKGLEAIINSEDNFLDISWLFGALYSAQAVCRIEIPEETPKGTGFLVGPDLLLTNQHVLKTANHVEKASVRFDYRVDSTGVVSSPGRLFKLDPSFYYSSDEKVLDYALVRVQGKPLETITVADPNPSLMDLVLTGKHRGYLTLKSEFITENDRVNIIQHPEGKPMKAVLTQNYVAGDMSKTRVQYVADTMEGSSGSPVFNQKWEVVALHHSGTPYPPEAVSETLKKAWKGHYRVNEGIPIRAIMEDFRAQGIERYLPSIK
jgi:V8-like Glu-specific endopeptidase